MFATVLEFCKRFIVLLMLTLLLVVSENSKAVVKAVPQCQNIYNAQFGNSNEKIKLLSDLQRFALRAEGVYLVDADYLRRVQTIFVQLTKNRSTNELLFQIEKYLSHIYRSKGYLPGLAPLDITNSLLNAIQRQLLERDEVVIRPFTQVISNTCSVLMMLNSSAEQSVFMAKYMDQIEVSFYMRELVARLMKNTEQVFNELQLGRWYQQISQEDKITFDKEVNRLSRLSGL